MLICVDGAVIRISLYGELWKINILILILIQLNTFPMSLPFSTGRLLSPLPVSLLNLGQYHTVSL